MEQDLIAGQIKNLSLEEFPSPNELYQRYMSELHMTDTEKKVLLEPYYYVSGYKTPRYYQRIAIDRTVNAVASGKDRVLLVCATGERDIFMTGERKLGFMRASGAWS